MKKTLERMTVLILVFTIIITGMTVFSIQHANAESDRPLPEKVSYLVLPDSDMNKQKLPGEFTYSISGCKSSNKSVAAVKGKSSRAYIFVKKAGCTDLTVKAKKKGAAKYKKYETVVTAYKYTNPFKTFKIGKKSYKKRYDNSLLYGTTGALKGKVTIKAAEGWKLVSISKMGPKDDDFIKIKNGSSVNIPQMGEVRIIMKHKASGQKVEFSNISM